MNFYDKIHELTRCLKETNEYKEYISLKNSLKEDEKAYNLIKEFKNKKVIYESIGRNTINNYKNNC